MNIQEKQTKKNSDTDNSVVVTRGKGVGEEAKGKGGSINGDRRRLDFGW